MRKRQRESNANVADALRSGVEALSISSNSFPSDLVYRDEQTKIIVDFLNDNVNYTMQLFGMPGTGKTATIHRALRQMASCRKAKPTAVFLNGYVIQKSTDIFRTLNLHLMKARKGSNEDLKPELCAANIEKHFRQGWGHPPSLCVIVLDEVDKVLKRHSKAFFKLVDWLTLPHARCKLIAISNSMELAVDAKTKSRLDITKRLVFSPYNGAELREIIDSRLGHIKMKIFSEQAVSLLCYQTAAHYGDVRRLLQCAAAAICSLMISVEDNTFPKGDYENGLISVKEIHSVIRHIFHDGFVEFVKTIRCLVHFVTVCAIAKKCSETVQLDAADSHLSLASVFKLVKSLQLKEVDGLSRGCFNEIIDTFRQVGLVELCVAGERVPLSSSYDLTEYGDDVVISLLQPVQTIVDSCRFHDEFGTYSKKIL